MHRSPPQSMIRVKLVFKNKVNKLGVFIKNKSPVVAKRFNQIEGIKFDQTFTHVECLESITLLGFKLFKMDVKIVFLNGFID